MLEKPVIIIGGGIWGSILALRLRHHHPRLRFELYEPTEGLGDGLSHSFHRSDISDEHFSWLRPFLTKYWREFAVEFPGFSRAYNDAYCFLSGSDIDHHLQKIIPSDCLFLKTSIHLEDALRRGSFVIDTRANGYFKAIGYQKSLCLHLEVDLGHGVHRPVTVDARVEQKDSFRFLQMLPLEDNMLLVKDTRYSTRPSLYSEYFEEDILNDCALRGLKVKTVLHREQEFRKIPGERFIAENSQRVIRLEGFYHDLTGDVLPDALRLIERMVQTSFRYGELKEVIRSYHSERESKKRLLRGLNNLLYKSSSPCSERYLYLQSLYRLPRRVREKFYAGDLEVRDIGLALLQKPLLPFLRLLPQFVLKNFGTTSPALPSRN